jgi:predicted transcriptional regulator YheO
MKLEMEQMKRMVHFLGDALGATYYAVLFDTTDPNYPVVASTGSGQEGAEELLRSFVSQALKSPKVLTRGQFANHPMEVAFGKFSKASIFLVTDEEEAIVGALCLNMQCDLLLRMQSFATAALQFNLEELDSTPSVPEQMVREPSLDSIGEIVAEFNIAPENTTPEERLEIMCDLYDAGVFRLKGAVAKTAEVLHMSEQSVYRYLTRIKKART